MTTVGRLAAAGAALGALSAVAFGVRWFARLRRSRGHRGAGTLDRGSTADAVADRPEGGWSLDLPDDPRGSG